MFKTATKAQAKLRLGLIGPAGSGKTYTALKLASGLGDKIAVIDTERGSASLYADKFKFQVCELESFHPEKYIEAIHQAEKAGFDVLVIDSLSHAWSGKDGALELVDNAAKRSQSGNSFTAWREVTPLHNKLVDTILNADMHVIITMRAKTEYVQEKNAQGKTVIRKVGLAPIQRDGMEYELTVVGDMTPENELVITKTRCDVLTGKVFSKPGSEVTDILKAWLSDGSARQSSPQTRQAASPHNEVNSSMPAGVVDELGYDGFYELLKTAKMQSLSDDKYKEVLSLYGVEVKDKPALVNQALRAVLEKSGAKFDAKTKSVTGLTKEIYNDALAVMATWAPVAEVV